MPLYVVYNDPTTEIDYFDTDSDTSYETPILPEYPEG